MGMSIEDYRALIHGQEQKSPTRQATGYKNKQDGKAFEELVDIACQHYAVKGIASIDKTPEPARYIKPISASTFEACYEKAAQPDYKGTLKGGCCVCFDAKHTNGDRINKSELTEEQEKQLRLHHQLGALCFVLVGIKMSKFYVIPWQDWEQMEQLYKYKHIKQKDMDKYQVSFKNGVINLVVRKILCKVQRRKNG